MLLQDSIVQRGFVLRIFGLKDKGLSPKRVSSCYITVRTEFAIAKFLAHISGRLNIIIYVKVVH